VCLLRGTSIVVFKIQIYFLRGHFFFSVKLILDKSLLFIPNKRTKYIKHIYLTPVTSYMLRRLLHHLQGDHCVMLKYYTLVAMLL